MEVSELNSALSFQIYHPKGALARWVQAIWSARVAKPCENYVKKLLYSDACSGLIFVLQGEVIIGENHLTQGGYFLPNSQQAQTISMLPGAQLAGLRLHPAVGFSFWQKNFSIPTPLEGLPDQLPRLKQLQSQLQLHSGHYAKIRAVFLYLQRYVQEVSGLPEGLSMALSQIKQDTSLQHVSIKANVGQRQLERQFKRWLSITPKQCQRVFRVAGAIRNIQNNLNESLANIAIDSGFSDQAHMTREFKQIASISPQSYRLQQIKKQQIDC